MFLLLRSIALATLLSPVPGVDGAGGSRNKEQSWRRVQRSSKAGRPVIPDPVGPYEYGQCKAYLDPHFKAWDGTFYDYMGACDLVLVRSSLAIVHIRAAAKVGYSDISNAALQIGADLLEFVAGGTIMRQKTDVTATPPTLIDGQYAFTIEDNSYTTTGGAFVLSKRYTVSLPLSQSIVVDDWRGRLSIYVTGTGAGFSSSEGLCGNWSGGGFKDRAGMDIEVLDREDLRTYAETWQVQTSLGDADLFATAGSATCIRTDTPATRRLTTSAEAAIICKNDQLIDEATKPDEFKNCVNDIVVGGPEFEDSFLATIYNAASEDIDASCAVDSTCAGAGGECVIGCDPAVNTCNTNLCGSSGTNSLFMGNRKLATTTRMLKKGSSSSHTKAPKTSKAPKMSKSSKSGKKGGKKRSAIKEEEDPSNPPPVIAPLPVFEPNYACACATAL